jgi:hypothetical protein
VYRLYIRVIQKRRESTESSSDSTVNPSSVMIVEREMGTYERDEIHVLTTSILSSLDLLD